MCFAFMAVNRLYQARVRKHALDYMVKRIKCIWWMPWQLKAMKDVVACDKPRGVGKQTLIRGCPNGETQPRRRYRTLNT